MVIDGARGLRSGVLAVFKGQVLIQRCQWHKRENVISYLPRAEQKSWRQRLQRAYQRPTYKEAVQDLKALRQDLAEVNQSAVASLDEGFEETLTLHRLGVFPLVGRSLKTTNAIESVNALAEQRCGRVATGRTPARSIDGSRPRSWRSSLGSGGCSATDTSRSSESRSRRTSGSTFPRAIHTPSPEMGSLQFQLALGLTPTDE